MTNQINKFRFHYVPELPNQTCFLISRNDEDMPVAFIEFAEGKYEVSRIRELSLADHLLILQEAERYRDSFFNPDFWNL
ncbi:MAG: hypothetical protein COT74_11685 [Bdellovibrionales bacterium CG10_big_fil_rev_8_21_14_0_10_45_34]|nr:MAG: hypothetical protein COT74_11685 [Bdellovibrionales bacterium CG10_big_fil_rev_8_21_14_0_10_45_34]